MPPVFVGQDCKYDSNFEALQVKEYLTQVLAKSYGAPEGSCEIHLYIRIESRLLATMTVGLHTIQLGIIMQYYL